MGELSWKDRYNQALKEFAASRLDVSVESIEEVEDVEPFRDYVTCGEGTCDYDIYGVTLHVHLLGSYSTEYITLNNVTLSEFINEVLPE